MPLYSGAAEEGRVVLHNESAALLYAVMVSPSSSSSSSVVSVPLSPFRRESIAVSDTGTEVTLRDGKDSHHHRHHHHPAVATSTSNEEEEEEEEDGSDGGCLVAEEDPHSCRRTPSSSYHRNSSKDPRPRSFSLLDSDVASVATTTLLSPETPSTLPLCGVVGCWSSSAATATAVSTPSSEEASGMRAAACMMEDGLQDYLYEFLSNPSASSSGGGHKSSSSSSFPWQAMLTTSMADNIIDEGEGDDDDDDDDDEYEEREITKHRLKVLRNRAIHLHARKQRLDTLRRDLYPFSSSSSSAAAGPLATPSPPPAGGLAAFGNGHNILPRSQSQPLSAPTKPRRKPLQDRTHHQHKNPSSQVWSSWSCHNIHQSPDALVWEDDEYGSIGGENNQNHHQHASCYDSDPEDSLRSRHYTPPPPPPPPPAAPTKNKRKSSATTTTTPNNTSIVLSDDLLYAVGNNNNTIYDIVQGAFNERWTFILHPGETSGNPCAVQAWMERGQRLSTTVIPPKLVYQFIGGKTSSSSSSTTTQQQQRLSRICLETPLYSIDLLEIQRVLEMHRVNRELYPFAKAPNTFTITTLSETICLEASSNSERDRIVRLLKLLVARFGSQLVTGDYRVEDFFTMIGNGPGGAHVDYNY